MIQENYAITEIYEKMVYTMGVSKEISKDLFEMNKIVIRLMKERICENEAKND